MVAEYPGEWLPEPVATESADTSVLRKEVLSYSLMVLLEKLDAKQRAVFILKEAFDYDHSEIAAVLNITEDNSRKILSRAKTRLKTEAPAEEKSIPANYLDKYLHVIRNGDTAQLEKLLTADITVVSDGGGKVAAFRKPVVGRKSVIALLQGIYIKFYNKLQIEPRSINHQPALFYYDGGKLVNCQVFSFNNGYVDQIFFIRNPDKLKALENNF